MKMAAVPGSHGCLVPSTRRLQSESVGQGRVDCPRMNPATYASEDAHLQLTANALGLRIPLDPKSSVRETVFRVAQNRFLGRLRAPGMPTNPSPLRGL